MSFQIGGMPGTTWDSYFNKTEAKTKGAKDGSNANKGKNDFEKALGSAGEYLGSANNVSQSAGTYTKTQVMVKRNESISTPKLSQKAQDLLDELKSKYSNMDFFIENAETDEQADAILAKGTKEYAVLIDPETLEKMAADEEFKNKCISTLEDSVNQMKEAFENMSEEDADKIQSVGFKMNTDGTVDFFAKLKDSSEAQKERIEKNKEKKAEEKKLKEEQENKKAEKEKEKKKQQELTVVHAASVSELLEQIKAFGVA